MEVLDRVVTVLAEKANSVRAEFYENKELVEVIKGFMDRSDCIDDFTHSDEWISAMKDFDDGSGNYVLNEIRSAGIYFRCMKAIDKLKDSLPIAKIEPNPSKRKSSFKGFVGVYSAVSEDKENNCIRVASVIGTGNISFVECYTVSNRGAMANRVTFKLMNGKYSYSNNSRLDFVKDKQAEICKYSDLLCAVLAESNDEKLNKFEYIKDYDFSSNSVYSEAKL